MEDYEKFYEKAIRFLSFRPRSEKEVTDSLKKKSRGSRSGSARNNPSPKIIESVINKLKEQKFLDDKEFSKWWIEQRSRFKPRSKRLMKLELSQKGIHPDIIDRLFSDLGIVGDDLDQAKKLVAIKIKRYRSLSREEIYQKLGRVLAQKGFSWDIIKKSIDEIL